MNVPCHQPHECGIEELIHTGTPNTSQNRPALPRKDSNPPAWKALLARMQNPVHAANFYIFRLRIHISSLKMHILRLGIHILSLRMNFPPA